MREDTFTSTVDGAAGYERSRGDYGGSHRWDDAPSRGEAEQWAAEDRRAAAREAEREDAARARGEYVPSPAMKMAVLTVRFRFPQAVAARDGVMWLPDVDLDTARTGLSGDQYEMAPGEGGTWVKVALNDGPPF